MMMMMMKTAGQDRKSEFANSFRGGGGAKFEEVRDSRNGEEINEETMRGNNEYILVDSDVCFSLLTLFPFLDNIPVFVGYYSRGWDFRCNNFRYYLR